MPGEEGHRFGDGVVDVLGDVGEETFPAWQKAADDAVALLRVAAAKAPYAKTITHLVGELAARSTEFRTRCATSRGFF